MNLLAAIGISLALSGGPHWSAPVEISTGDRALGPELAMNPNGDAFVVWDQEVGADCPTTPASLSCVHIVKAAARPRTTSAWQAPLEINRPGVGSTPRAALNANGAGAIVWVHDIGQDRVAQATYRRDPLGQWPDPNDLSDSALSVKGMRIALDAAGDAVAAWQEFGNAGWAIEAAVRPASSGVWSAPVALDVTGPQIFSGPALAVGPSGQAIVAFVDFLGAVWVATGQSATGTWGPLERLSPDSGYAESGPAVVLGAGGDAAAAWIGATHLEAAFRPQAGGWEAAVDVGNLATHADPEPNVAVDGSGDAAVVWLDDGVLRSSVRSAAQGSWSPQRDLAPNATASDPHIAMTFGGNAIAVWTTADGAAQAAIRPASGDWQPPVVLARNASGVRVGIDDASRAVAVWNRTEGDRVVVEAADLTGTAPVLDRLRIPKRARVHHRVVFSVRASRWVSTLSGPPVWRFGDGSSARGTRVTHAYAHRGRYVVRVTQIAGPDQATASGTITVRRR